MSGVVREKDAWMSLNSDFAGGPGTDQGFRRVPDSIPLTDWTRGDGLWWAKGAMPVMPPVPSDLPRAVRERLGTAAAGTPGSATGGAGAVQGGGNLNPTVPEPNIPQTQLAFGYQGGGNSNNAAGALIAIAAAVVAAFLWHRAQKKEQA